MMKLVEVIPIARGIGKESLTYFAAADFPIGSVISVPVRNRTIPAIVITCKEVRKAKTQIRKSEYLVKKIASEKTTHIFSAAFVDAIQKIADYHATTPGAALFALTAKHVRENMQQLTPLRDALTTTQQKTVIEKLLIQAPRTERYEQYKNLIRESFARKKSVMLCVPTLQDAAYAEEFLTKGISQYAFSFNSSLTKKETVDQWNTVLDTKHSVLLIVTGSFLSVPRHDIHTLIVEHEQSQAYKGNARPFIDIRRAAEFIAEHAGYRLVLGDLPLRIDSMYRYKKRELEEFSPLKNRLPPRGDTELIDMRERKPDQTKTRKKFLVISDELREAIEKTLKEKGTVFAFSARKGLAPVTVCQDCGNTVKDELTDTPVILYKGKKDNVFISHASGTIRSANERCKYCTSWRLEALGIGIELVHDELKELFPDTPVLIMDKDNIKTHKQAQRLMTQLRNAHGAILLGTEMAIPYIEDVDMSTIVSIDSLLALPEWNVYERVFSIILRIRERTTGPLLLQTRKPEQYVLKYALAGNLIDFYKEELSMREQFSYPPYSTIIRVSLSGGRDRVEREMQKISKFLEPYGFSGESHLMNLGRNRFMMHGFLRIERKHWPDQQALAALRSLPQEVVVMVDPPSIL